MSSWVLGAKSLEELELVDPQLVVIVVRALELSVVDFSVADGARVLSEQRELVGAGVSQTLESWHLVQEDGFAKAVDLVPYIAGRLRWEWEPIYAVCRAMKQAAAETRTRVRWGGAWQELARIDKPQHAHAAYLGRRQTMGRAAFADGPHYELVPG